MGRRRGNKNTRLLSSSERWALCRRWGVILLQGVLLIAVVLVSAWGGLAAHTWTKTTPRLKLQEIDVVGNVHALDEAVLLLAGDLEGVPLLDVVPQDVADRVVAHPWISWVAVSRGFPDRLVIEVLEREPAALLLAEGLYYVDASGTPFIALPAGNPVDMPILTGFDDPKSPLRVQRDLGRHAVREGLRLLGELERAGYGRAGISEVHVDPEVGFSVFLLNTGTELVLGWEDFAGRLEKLRKLETREGLTLSQVARVDLDLERSAVVTLAPLRGSRGK